MKLRRELASLAAGNGEKPGSDKKQGSRKSTRRSRLSKSQTKSRFGIDATGGNGPGARKQKVPDGNCPVIRRRRLLSSIKTGD